MIVKAKLNKEEFEVIESSADEELVRLSKIERKKRVSRFTYRTAGGSYIPTLGQYNFCLHYPKFFKTDVEKYARDEVICGFLKQKEIHHDYIHIVNVKKRKFYDSQL